MGVHDIFLQYARSIPECSESYVNIIVNSREDVRSPKARTMCLNVDMQLWRESKKEILIEVGPQTKALFVRNHVGIEKAAKAKLHLCGDPSSLVHLRLEKVELIKWPTTTCTRNMQMINQVCFQHHAHQLLNLKVLKLSNVCIPGHLLGPVGGFAVGKDPWQKPHLP